MGVESVDGVLEALVLLVPAMVANASPVVFKGRRPIDGGLVFIDGRRLLGDGKTIEGFIAGLLLGSLSSLPLALAVGRDMMLAGPVIALGALLGDLAGSFMKRRLGIERGAPAPLLDQLDFYLGAVAASIILGYSWSPRVLVATGAVVVLLHVSANYLAYRLGLKQVPW